MLGLKRNAVKLQDHSPEWDKIASQNIKNLWEVFCTAAVDIQHVGSTSIRHIKAKPDMLIAVGVKSMDIVDEIIPRLRDIGIVQMENRQDSSTVLCAFAAEIESGVHTLYVHIVPHGSKVWNENINFRDYMNASPQSAAEYESLKISLAKQFPDDRRAYKNGKLAFFKKVHQDIGSFYAQATDGISYKLKEPFDFSFLSKYGRVFKVFDDQDSGNICFGMANGADKCFVKFAGAPTARANVPPQEAVERMKQTAQIYMDLAHPNLTGLISTEEIGGGFACVFEWMDAECFGMQYPQSREKFLQLGNETRLQVFDDILAFHSHVAQQGYVAIDFYDGCIMYDFANNKTIICDVEFYAKAPYVNDMGRMWGSSRFMSPEEFQLGAAIDEVTNVYAMGATAFELFGSNHDRSFEKWMLNKALFDIATKAVSLERGNRQQSVQQFIDEWQAERAGE